MGVAAADINIESAEAVASEIGGKSIAVQADATSAESLEALAQKAAPPAALAQDPP